MFLIAGRAVSGTFVLLLFPTYVGALLVEISIFGSVAGRIFRPPLHHHLSSSDLCS